MWVERMSWVQHGTRKREAAKTGGFRPGRKGFKAGRDLKLKKVKQTERLRP